MNKREIMRNWLADNNPAYTPAAFFTHFGEDYQFGPAAIDKHLDFFHTTGMDFVKIQYELPFPPIGDITSPEDWDKLPVYDTDFFAPQLDVTRALVEAMHDQALVLQTLYSPFASAGHTTSDALITKHIKTAPDKARIGLERAAKGILNFVHACIDIGVDGFYASTQGGEAHRFASPDVFESVIKPYDLMVLDDAFDNTPFNILHICDWHGPYANLATFADYPGDVVSASLAHPSGKRITLRDVAQQVQRPVMGGVDRHGNFATMTTGEVTTYIKSILADAPPHTILGADCTVPGDRGWNNIRAAIQAAHRL